jgi:hypothetical protein
MSFLLPHTLFKGKNCIGVSFSFYFSSLFFCKVVSKLSSHTFFIFFAKNYAQDEAQDQIFGLQHAKLNLFRLFFKAMKLSKHVLVSLDGVVGILADFFLV